MEIVDFTLHILSFGIVGAIVSIIIDTLKSEKHSPIKKRILTVVVSFIAGSLIAWLYKSNYATTITSTLGAASTFYSFILKKNNEK